ncbi:tail fiber domain-containing protein [Flavobacterium humidisoli]|uniref:Tail fiber domain-containing protein n=1 Tax=Flavobacterium humidisoli TaxID=2937442 RepID=A0ABY4LZL8_9FLAO|nr:tail fiber domain-containing protein [Flavobacterium humidisoli]UPZ17878.1 tail fiber domain-containing protein [Flavobacterium humidisoli]
MGDSKAVYTYTNEKGDKVKIDVPGDVANNFQEIINNSSVQNILDQYIVNNVEGNVSYDAAKNTFTYVDSSGAVQVIDIASMVKANETVTTLVGDSKAVYTYTNEKGDKVKIDVPGDVANNFQEIINNSSVQNILDQYIVNNVEGNVSYDAAKNTFTYVDSSGAVQVIDIASMVKANETVTTLVGDSKAVYTYTNEKGDKVKIDVPGDVANNFQEIINNSSVQNILDQYIVNNVEGNVSYDAAKNTFTYVDSSGAVQVIDIASMVKANETVTTLVGDSKAVYTYTNEKGDKVKIDVPGDVANNFQEIINNSSVQNILDQYIVNNVEGNVSYDAAKNTFTYVDSSGAVQVIDIASMVKANETVTTLVGDSKAVYTYTNEKGDKVKIDVPGDVANNFQEIINNSSVQNILNQYIVNNVEGNVSYDADNNTFTYVDSSGAVQVIDIASMVKANETVTTLVGDSKAVYTYTNEKGDKVKIDVPGDVANNFQEIINNSSVQNILNQYIVNNVEGNVSYDADNNTFTYVDSSGAVQVIDIASMVKANETVTTLVGDSKAVYTYTNEKGDKVKIDVPGDVANNFQEIINNSSVQNILDQYIVNNVEGNVSYDAAKNTFTYVDSSGAVQVIDIASMVKANETVTTLVGDSKAVYTYTNEKGDKVKIDVPGDVANNFQEIINNSSVQNILDQYIVNNVEGNVSYDAAKNTFTYVDSSGAVQVIDIASMVKANETVTTLVGDSKAVYTYTNEKGDKVKIDVPGDVANNFQEIINNSSVQNILDQYIVNNVEGNVSYDAAKNTFTYVDSSGAVQVIDIAPMVKANETVTTLQLAGNKLVYRNEKGDNPDIDLSSLTNTAWNIAGNAGTSADSNFLGTTDPVDLVFRTNKTEKMRITSTGNVGIANSNPEYALDIIGDAKVSNNVYCASVFTTSDVRLKKNIKNLNDGLKTISLLRPVTYIKKTNMNAKDYTISESGFIAQEVRKVLPDLVTEMNDPDKTLIVNYNAVIPILTKAIQEQQVQIEAQQKQIDMLVKALEHKK